MFTYRAMERIFDAGIIVRNQAVLQQGVNATVGELILLIKKLSYINIIPYYVYLPDLVPGCEHLRSTLAEGIELEKCIRGITSGFNIPNLVCDLPGGGGKRHVASYEYYDRDNGISVWSAPFVKPDQLFTYFDPIHRLSKEAQQRWANPQEREAMMRAAMDGRAATTAAAAAAKR
ncbi:MAG: hypothetical protein HQK53_13045 [Oligoflexia bacterium]|nr:hypothetical protein [Oligoflexia bacterium]